MQYTIFLLQYNVLILNAVLFSSSNTNNLLLQRIKSDTLKGLSLEMLTFSEAFNMLTVQLLLLAHLLNS